MYVSTSQRPSGLSLWRTLLAAFAVLALVTSALGLAQPVLADHDGTHLQPGQVGLTDADFECPPEDEGRGWHFILSPPGGGDQHQLPVFLHAVINDDTYGPIEGQREGGGDSGAIHFWVPAPEGTITDAWVDVTGGNLVVSHVCPVVEEEVLGAFSILKLDENEDPFEGVTFRLLQNGATVDEQTTGADGTLRFEDLDPGTYTLVEVAPEGYVQLEPWTVVVDAEGNVTINGTAVNDDPFVIINEPEEPGAGIIQIHKQVCPGDEPTDFIPLDPEPIDAFGTMQAEEPEEPCRWHPNQSFSLWLLGADFEEDDPIRTGTTDAFGILHFFDVPEGTYILREDQNGLWTEVTVEEGHMTLVLVTNFMPEEDEEGLLKVIKLFCPTVGEGPLFYIIDANVDEENIPELEFDFHTCPLGAATFQLFKDGEPFGAPFTTTAGFRVGNLGIGMYTLAEIIGEENGEPIYGPESPAFTITEGEVTTVIVVNLEEEVDQPDDGRIEIIKELEGECPVCPTFTPGYWFNRGGGGGTADADTELGTNPIRLSIDGPEDLMDNGDVVFTSVADVHLWLDWDLRGGDGQRGLSAAGQLLRHYLALEMNVRHSGDCPLDELLIDMNGELISVAGLLGMARDLLEGDADDAELRALKDIIAAINEGEATFECPEDTVGGSVAGFVFELWREGDEEPFRVSDPTGADGTAVFEDLPPDTYTIMEHSPEGLVCVIVEAWLNGEPLTVVDGTVTVTLGEGDDLTITVVNECVPAVDGELGDITVIKDADPDDTNATFGFTFNGAPLGLIGHDGELFRGELSASGYTILETDLPAGWSLDDVVCDADVWEPVAGGVTVTLGEGESVVCIFFNVFDDVDVEQPGERQIMILKRVCETIGANNVCNGRDDSLEGMMIDYVIFEGEGTTGAELETVTLTVGLNLAGHGQVGGGSEGTVLSSEGLTPGGTYTVCEIPVAYDEVDEVDLEVYPFPQGARQVAHDDNCIVVTLTPGPSGIAVLQFHNLVAEEEVLGPPPPGNGVDNGEQAVLPGVGMPDTAAGTGAPTWLPILLAMGLIGSVGALATANVAARRRQ